jgi:hypothetical protein
MLIWARRKNMRRFRKFRDERFALTTLQNPLVEVRTYAELVQAAQQERENRAAAAQIPAPVTVEVPATPPPPAPVVECAPDSIPPAQVQEQFQEIIASEDPDPLVGAAEPLDFANNESADPDAADLESPRPARANPAVQQLLDALGISLDPKPPTEVPALPVLEDEPMTDLAPMPRPKTKPRRKRKSRRKLAQTDRPEPTPLERHARKCSICRHPQRQLIEEAFLHWRSPDTIMNWFNIVAETTIYHHAHAFNLFAQRNRNLQSALGNIVEELDRSAFTTRDMLDAVRALAHVNEDGRWIHPPTKSEIVYSVQRLPAAASLPAGQAALPAAAAQPLLIASPILETDANR